MVNHSTALAHSSEVCIMLLERDILIICELTPIATKYKVHIGAEGDDHTAVAHEVVQLDLLNHTHLTNLCMHVWVTKIKFYE